MLFRDAVQVQVAGNFWSVPEGSMLVTVKVVIGKSARRRNQDS